MAVFHYAFQRILDLKEKEKGQAQAQMAKAIQKQEKVELRMVELNESISSSSEEIGSLQEQGVSIQELRMMESYKEHLHQKLVQEKSEYSLAKKNVDKKQEVLVEKLKEEKTWNFLKEKKQEEHRIHNNKQEQLILDEMASIRYNRLS